MKLTRKCVLSFSCTFGKRNASWVSLFSGFPPKESLLTRSQRVWVFNFSFWGPPARARTLTPWSAPQRFHVFGEAVVRETCHTCRNKPWQDVYARSQIGSTKPDVYLLVPGPPPKVQDNLDTVDSAAKLIKIHAGIVGGALSKAESAESVDALPAPNLPSSPICLFHLAMGRPTGRDIAGQRRCHFVNHASIPSHR